MVKYIMLIKLIISFIFIILQIRLVFADIVDVNNKEINNGEEQKFIFCIKCKIEGKQIK